MLDSRKHCVRVFVFTCSGVHEAVFMVCSGEFLCTCVYGVFMGLGFRDVVFTREISMLRSHCVFGCTWLCLVCVCGCVY